MWLVRGGWPGLGRADAVAREDVVEHLEPVRLAGGHLHAHEFTALHPLGDEIVKLDIYNYPVIVTRDGPKEAEMELLNSIVINTQSKDEMQ